ncbi:MAG: hypothetical protein HC921_06580 [Synechococcaceae cyanobacterium SM2_3_1]|nr:hypothetical protein [Synechococcaceae cyanobacterium SM2_3_1]
MDILKVFGPYLACLLDLLLRIPDDRITELISNIDKYVPSIHQYRKEHLVEVNPLANWVNKSIEPDPYEKSGIRVQQLYESYVDYCEKSNEKPIALKVFSSKIIDLLINQLSWDNVGKKKTARSNTITGIILSKSTEAASIIDSGGSWKVMEDGVEAGNPSQSELCKVCRISPTNLSL